MHNLQLMANKEAEAGSWMASTTLPTRARASTRVTPRAPSGPWFPLRRTRPHSVAKGSGIKSLKDFKGKRVSIGAVASGTEVTAKELLKSPALIPRRTSSPKTRLSDTAQAFSNKQIDAAITVGAVGSRVSSKPRHGRRRIHRPPGRPGQAGQWQDALLLPFTIPANTYKGQPSAVKTVASWNIIGVRDDLDADLAYKMTKSLFENKKNLVNVSARMEGMTAENVKVILIPLHIGAKKYYKEIGAVTM